MPQLYAQIASRPDPWLLGRTSAGLCTLHVACPLTVTYSGGSPAADTIAAGSAATVYVGGAAAFDASADVWVVLTVAGSGALQVTKEADLAAVTGDWAGLARIVQHAVEPYQPSAYLAAGGVGSPAPQTVTVPSGTSARAYNVGVGGTPPANWQTSGYDDSAWSAAVVTPDDAIIEYIAGCSMIWSAVRTTGADRALVRHHVSLPAGTITAATLLVSMDEWLQALYVNGTALGSTPYDFGSTIPHPILSYDVAPLLTAGASNLLALYGQNDANPGDPGGNVNYQLSVTYTAPGISGAAEGDLLYYHSGAWSNLPIGASGQELRVVSGDPAWATPSGGTVTSVALSGPTGTTASGSPVTSSGTLSLAWASQSANVVLSSPNGSSGAPTFRALVGADIPVDASTIVVSSGTIKGNYQAGSGVSISGNTISATGSGGSVTSVALSMPSSVFSTAGSPITTSGTLAVSLQTQTSHTVWAGPASGSAAAPTFRALQGSDLPAAAGAGGHIHAHGHFH